MLIAEALITSDQDQPVLQVTKTRNLGDMLAYLYFTAMDSHEARNGTRCYVDPPRWTYWLGVNSDLSLGGLLWRLGQAASNRLYRLPVVHRASIGWEDLPRFDLDPRDVARVRQDYAD